MKQQHSSPPVRRDVCILGAGASGMSAADRLRELGYTVAVLERSERVGGHSETYRSALKFYNVGVRVYRDTPLLRSVFAKYDVPLERVNNNLPNQYFDGRTGQRSSYQIPSKMLILRCLLQYIYLLRSRHRYIDLPGIHLPSPVPEELLMPYGKWLEAHGMDKGYAPVTHYLQGMGGVSKITTLFAFKNLRAHIAESVIRNNFVTPVNGVEHLYHTIARTLGDDLHLGARIRSVVRPAGQPVQVVADTPSGAVQVTCDRLLVCFPPLLSNLEPFDVSPLEQALFSKLKYRQYCTSIVAIDGLESDRIHSNVAADPVNDDILPAIYSIMPTPFPGRFNVLYGSNTRLPDEVVQANIERDINRLTLHPGHPPIRFKGFDFFKTHFPYDMHVDPSEVREGFYDKLLQLQGQRSTYYLGATVDTGDTAALWAHAEQTIQTMRGARWYFPPLNPASRAKLRIERALHREG